jgi:hypothetical protein
MGLSRANLIDIASRTGYPVRAAWVSRGHGTMGTVVGVMRHHTGTPLRAGQDNYPTLRIIREGRSDLPGPLANYGLGRDGTVYLITEQVAWHAGAGSWGGVTDGNGHFLGIEAESDGQAATWTDAQKDAYPRLVAAALDFLGRDASGAPRHAQYARPAGRKSDTAGLDEVAFIGAVSAYLRTPTTLSRNSGGRVSVKPGTPAPAEEDDDMALWTSREEFRADLRKGVGAGGLDLIRHDEFEAHLKKAIREVLAERDETTEPEEAAR